MTMQRARRWAGVLMVVPAIALVGAGTAAAQQQKRPLVVQSTTSVRDSGVLDQLITPQFEKRFPQYDLKFVAVGTGQAITNARAGPGDVPIGHPPALQQRVVRGGFSHAPNGRAALGDCFRILGPAR